MKKLKKFGVALAVLAVGVGLAACGKSEGKAAAEKVKIVKIGVVGDEQNPIFDAVNENLKKENIKVELVKFNDGIIINQALADKELDLTAFQHYAFLNEEIKSKGYEFTVIGDTFIVPLNIYSDKLKDVSEIKEGDKIAIPNNVTNAGRALRVLESAGLIKVDSSKGYLPDVKDITENKLNLEIIEVDPSQIPSLLPDFAAGIFNSGFAIDNHIDPVKDSIYSLPVDAKDENNKPYINVIVARTADKDDETYKKVVEAYHSDSVAKKILEEYNGVYVPVWSHK